jgi:DNA mismatch repair protein MutS2
MPFAPGDAVHVPGLGKGVVREVRRERVLVEIKGRSLLVPASRVAPVARPDVRHAPPAAADPGDAPHRSHAPASIDLHGLTPDEALAALDAFINDAILAGHAGVQVIHGRGAGRLKDLVHRRLSAIAAVRHVRLDPANAGVTLVTL